MRRLTRAFCWAVLRLEYLPAYRRLYRLQEDGTFSKPEWRYLRHGLWGIFLLERLDLFWPYIELVEAPQGSEPDPLVAQWEEWAGDEMRWVGDER